MKLDSGKEKIENDQSSLLQKSDDLSNVKFIQKGDNVTKVCHNKIIIYCCIELFLKLYLFN